MEFFLELLLTAVVALLVSFIVANLVSISIAGNTGGGVNDRSSDQTETTEVGVGDDSVTVEELSSCRKMDAGVVQRERKLRALVDENVEHVDRFKSEADRVLDELQEAAKGEDFVIRTVEDDEFLATVSPENAIFNEMMVEAAEDASTCSVSLENVVAEELMIRGQEEVSESTQETSAENVKRGSESDVFLKPEEVRVEESSTVEESEHKMELNTQEEGEHEEKEELSIEDDDDDDDGWEGVERTELEKAFASASNLLEESGKAEEIGAEAKMELYALHKIATEGSCREARPMAVMVSARAKWNAWQKLGNMNQEEAMEQYLSLVSKEIPGLIDIGHTFGKMSVTENSVVLPPNSGSLDDPTTLETTGVASTKNGER